MKILKPDGILIISTPNPLLWRTVIMNAYFRYGLNNNGPGETGFYIISQYYGHIILHQPRLLNRVFLEINLKMKKILSTDRGLNILFMQTDLIYILKKKNAK